MQIMKRFWLFSGDYYYPQGGMRDFIESFDTKEEAKELYLKIKTEWSYQWYHIFDLETGEWV